MTTSEGDKRFKQKNTQNFKHVSRITGKLQTKIVKIIRRLASHLELHKIDFSSERGLRILLGKRRRLLAYLVKKNRVRYKKLISQLNIREQ